MKELYEQEAKDLYLALKSYFEPKNVMKNTHDDWLKANIKSFNWRADTVNFTKVPTDLNVEVKTMDDNVVTARNLYRTRTLNCC